jgi:hypothetical protein
LALVSGSASRLQTARAIALTVPPVLLACAAEHRGEIDYSGSISKCGDRRVRTLSLAALAASDARQARST